VSAFSTFGKALRASIIILGCVVGVVFTYVSIIVFIGEPLPLTHLAKQEYEALYIYTVILYYVAGLFINLVALILSIFTLKWYPKRWVKPTAIVLNLTPIVISMMFLFWAEKFWPGGTN
jgi:hypothetical protein